MWSVSVLCMYGLSVCCIYGVDIWCVVCVFMVYVCMVDVILPSFVGGVVFV